MSNYLLSFLDTFIDASLKMKALLRAEARLHSTLILDESFNLIVEETCRVLDCDRASVFLLDKQKEGIC
jgi:GAF domain-containing protein